MLPILLTLIMQTSLYDFSMKDIDGNNVKLSDYKGKTVLIVNVASFCGYTKQYAPLEQLYTQYKDKGLVILGFPANDFGAQEPGTDTEIKEFCSTKYNVTFPMFSKVTVKGADKHPLFVWLTSGGGDAALAGEIGWNFEKFLVGPDGRLVARYETRTEPMSETVKSDIERSLGVK
jgi:glutathione peroxidase